MKENLLDHICYHKKWHSTVQKKRKPYLYSMNESLTEYIVKKINVEKGFFVEFGAMDGIRGSNCRKLYENQWNGIFIEPNFEDFKKLRENYAKTNIITLNKKVELSGDNTFDNIMKQNNVKEIDFLSIDVDGLDLQIFKTINYFFPKVICIEGGQLLNPFEKEISIEKEKQAITQSLSLFVEEFEKKDYKILCCYQDIFFIKKEFYHLFEVETDIYNLYLDGIMALPRIPYLKELLDNVGLKNNIIDFILKRTRNKNKKNRELWVKDNYSIITECIKSLRTNRI